MTDDPQPTPLDIANAEARRAISDRQAVEYGEAMRLALGVLGPGWAPWMKLSLIPSDHRETGEAAPVAVVYKVYRGEKRLTERSTFLRRMPDGTVARASRYEPVFGELLHEKHPTKTIEVRGQQVPVGRYELCWSALGLYQPRSAEELAKLRAYRAQRKAEREAAAEREANPLFTVWAERLKAEREREQGR